MGPVNATVPLRVAWASLERAWAASLERAAAMPAGTVDVSVDGEWSFAQTLRHLVHATDVWLRRGILEVEQPFHTLGLGHAGPEDEATDASEATATTPPYAEVLEAREERVAMVRDFLATVTPDELAAPRKNPHDPEYEETTLSCLHVILEEEWEHQRFAVRDLGAIEAKPARLRRCARAESPVLGDAGVKMPWQPRSTGNNPDEATVTSNPARGNFDPVPSTRHRVTISVAGALPPVDEAAALAVPVADGAEPPGDLGTDAAHLEIAGFTGKTGQHLVIPGADGRALVAVGIGDADSVDLTRVRDVAADFARAVSQHLTLAVELPDGATAIAPADFAQVVVEGVLLARWRFFVGKGGDEPTLKALTIVAPDDVAEEVRAGVARGETIARAAADRP